MPPHKRWTQTDIVALRARVQAGETVPQIADGLAHDPESVRSMMSRLSLK